MAREQRLQAAVADLSPSHLDIINESHQHGGPGTETHFKLVLVSEAFVGLRPVARHQLVYARCQSEMASGLHALALHLYTAAEWAETGQAPASPACRGGSRHD